MADFSITISNVVGVFGPEPTEAWGYMVWGTDKWAYATEDLPATIGHVVDNTQTVDSDITKLASHQVDESLVLGSETTSEYLTDGSGYNYVFPGNVTNADNRISTNWTALTYDTATYTTSSRPTTTWT